MNHEAAILLFVLLWAIGILPLTGAASFWYGRWAERRAAATGALQLSGSRAGEIVSWLPLVHLPA